MVWGLSDGCVMDNANIRRPVNDVMLERGMQMAQIVKDGLTDQYIMVNHY